MVSERLLRCAMSIPVSRQRYEPIRPSCIMALRTTNELHWNHLQFELSADPCQPTHPKFTIQFRTTKKISLSTACPQPAYSLPQSNKFWIAAGHSQDTQYICEETLLLAGSFRLFEFPSFFRHFHWNKWQTSHLLTNIGEKFSYHGNHCYLFSRAPTKKWPGCQFSSSDYTQTWT